MLFSPIGKDVAAMEVRPNLLDYNTTRTGFSWEAVRQELDGLPGGGLNIAHEAVDRHASGPLCDRAAIRFLGKEGTLTPLSYGELQGRCNQFAHLLGQLEVLPGDRVFWLAGRSLLLYAAFFGTLKLLSALCRLWPGTHRPAAGARQRPGTCHHRAPVQ